MWLFLLLAILQPVSIEDSLNEEDPSAIEAYRSGDYGTAQLLWKQALDRASDARERGRLRYTLGNTAYRQEEFLSAVGWYTSALRDLPRDADLRANLELARLEAGLQPADRGDLAATLRRLLSSLSRAEAAWLSLVALAFLATALAFEALRGGSLWRRVAVTTAALAALGACPLLWHTAQVDERQVMVTAKDGVEGRSEPRLKAQRISRFQGGEVLTWMDALPGWVQVRDGGQREQWVPEDTMFDLGSRGHLRP